MTSIFSYLTTLVAIIFWVFRIIITVLSSMGMDFAVVPIDMTLEVVVLFVTLFSFIFIIKRNTFGALIYFVTYGLYFGTYIYNSITSESVELLSLVVSIIGIIIATFTLLDILINKNRSIGNGDKKTDWYYKGDQFDRQKDERADKNQYKF